MGHSSVVKWMEDTNSSLQIQMLVTIEIPAHSAHPQQLIRGTLGWIPLTLMEAFVTPSTTCEQLLTLEVVALLRISFHYPPRSTSSGKQILHTGITLLLPRAADSSTTVTKTSTCLFLIPFPSVALKTFTSIERFMLNLAKKKPAMTDLRYLWLQQLNSSITSLTNSMH